MLSRSANSIYWMSRYAERAENVARLIEVNLNLLLDQPTGQGEQWRPLVMITGDEGNFADRYGEPTRQNVMEFLTFDPDNPNSIVSSLRAARENARSVREAISSEMWEQINGYYLMVRDPGARQAMADDPHEFFTQVKLASQLFVGVADATLSHNEGWHFANLGRMIERADKTSRILDVKYFLLLPSAQDVGTPLDALQWSAMLRSASGFEMYRRRHGRITPENVVEFLMIDRDFPRSMLFCLCEARDSLHAISGTPAGSYTNVAEQRLAQVHAELAYASVEEVLSRGLHEFLDAFQLRLNRVDDAVFDTFFALRPHAGLS